MVDNVNIVLQMFINEHSDDIDNNNFDKVYTDAYPYFKDDTDIGLITEMLHSCDIHPEEYFTSAIHSAFAYNTSDITDIVIHKDIIKVGGEAFYRSCLKSVTFETGSRLNYISMYAFRDTLLTEVDLPEGVKTISAYSFGNCGHLTRIYIPDSYTNIADTAFFGSENVIIECHENSVAQKFAIQHEIEYKLI